MECLRANFRWACSSPSLTCGTCSWLWWSCALTPHRRARRASYRYTISMGCKRKLEVDVSDYSYVSSGESGDEDEYKMEIKRIQREATAFHEEEDSSDDEDEDDKENSGVVGVERYVHTQPLVLSSVCAPHRPIELVCERTHRGVHGCNPVGLFERPFCLDLTGTHALRLELATVLRIRHAYGAFPCDDLCVSALLIFVSLCV